MNNICVYAQTFPVDSTGKLSCTELDNLISNVSSTTGRKVIVYVASLHFGTDSTGKKYLHLNDTDTANLDYFFSELESIYDKYQNYCEIRVMLGGAGGAYTALFSSFDDYYALLRSFLMRNRFLSGIDLDIEEVLDADPSSALEKGYETNYNNWQRQRALSFENNHGTGSVQSYRIRNRNGWILLL